MASWAEMEVVRDGEGCIDELGIAVDCAPTEEAACERARREYGDPPTYVPIVAERVWMHVRECNLDDEYEAGHAEEYGSSIVVDCEPDAEHAREFWRVLAVDPSEVEMVRGELAEREKERGDVRGDE